MKSKNEKGNGDEANAHRLKLLPFEFVALEACLEAACSSLDDEEDITDPRCRAAIKRVMAENGVPAFDLVLHDGSPNVGGAWAKEATNQNALVIDSVKLTTKLLAPKGTFITKVFRSQDYTAVLYCLRQLFEKVEVDKSQASRSASAEIYIVGLKPLQSILGVISSTNGFL